MSQSQLPGRGRPKVLIVVTLAEVGGVASYLGQLLPGLRDEFDVTVAAQGDGPVRSSTENLGMRFIGLKQMRRSLHPIRDVAAVGELLAIMWQTRPDIVHAHSSKAGLIARVAAAIARVPIRVFTVHGWAFSAYSGAASTLFRFADRSVRPLTTMVVCPARAVMEAGFRAHTCSPGRSVVIPNAVDVSKYDARSRRGPVRIVSVGRLAFPKNFRSLIEALAMIPDREWTARIVGDGPQRRELEGEVERLGLSARVSFLGTRTDIPQILGDSNVFVLASDSECLPMSVIEAMASGLPVVASSVGGVPELVVSDQTGILVPPSDPEALSRAIGMTIDNRSAADSMGASGRRRAEEYFDVPRFRRLHRELYLSLLAEKGGGIRTAARIPERSPEDLGRGGRGAS